ncbi:MAG TPA: hypothetical protein VEB41_04875 [Burkholderiales bacterium]|nr:hypothetical protein [Burkholderiales bacterium]
MSSRAELDVLYKIGNAPVLNYPFPHFFVRDVFPADYYAEMQRNLPRPEAMKSLEEARGTRGYPERSVMTLGEEAPAFWAGLWRWMLGGRVGHLMLQKFAPVVQARLQGIPDAEITDEAILVHDRTQYALGPHSDSPRKLITMLFYLPADERLARYGTSIYVPKDPDFRCPGGPHYSFEIFDRMATMPFVPNALFAFAKTDNSFHGVERFDVPNAGRWLLLVDLYVRQGTAAAAPQAAPGGPSVAFKF